MWDEEEEEEEDEVEVEASSWESRARVGSSWIELEGNGSAREKYRWIQGCYELTSSRSSPQSWSEEGIVEGREGRSLFRSRSLAFVLAPSKVKATKLSIGTHQRFGSIRYTERKEREKRCRSWK